MHTPFLLRQQLKSAIAAADLAAVAAIVDNCKRAGADDASSFGALFAPEDPDDGSPLPLFEAIRTGQQAIVRYLLEQGCSLEQRDKSGATPLYRAFASSRPAIAAELIGAGADIRATTKIGTRVLDMVLYSGDMERLDWFLQQGVALASVNQKGFTALHFACNSGNIALAMRVAGQCGLAFDCAALNGRRPLDWCHDDALFAAILAYQPGIAPDIDFAAGGCSLHDFARRGSSAIVCRLLDGGSDASRLDGRGNTLMHSAVASHNAGLVQELLLRKIKVEGRNTYNYRPLHWAAMQGDLDIARLLVEQGRAKVNIKGNLNFIIRETKTPLYLAIDEGHVELARYLVDQGADLNALNDSSNRTAVHAAAGLGDCALLRYLLERGASPNGVNRGDANGRADFYSFPLANAANAAVVDLLMEFGADINAQNSNIMRSESALRSLVDRVEKKDLDTERGRGHLAAIEALLRHGASLSDGGGAVLNDAKCAEVMRLLRAAEQREVLAPAESEQARAGEAHRGFIQEMANLMSGGRHEEHMHEMETERRRTGLGVALFEQANYCRSVAQVEMLIEMLHDASGDDVNYQSADSYYNEESVLHRLLDSFRCYEAGDEAPLSMVRQAVKLLLDKGANPDALESLYDETPFHKAAKMASSGFGNGRADDDAAVLAILQDFCDAGANPNLPNEEGAHVIDLLNHPQLVAWMRAHQGCHGEYPEALFDALNYDKPQVLADLLGGAPNRFGVNKDGCNLLEYWARQAVGEHDWPKALRVLDTLEKGGFVVNARTDDGMTALIHACREGALQKVEWLLAHYAWDLNAQDDWGGVALGALVAASSPYHSDAMTPKQCRERRQALAVAMVGQGARLDLADEDGDTPLSLCPTVALKTALERAGRAREKAGQKGQRGAPAGE